MDPFLAPYHRYFLAARFCAQLMPTHSLIRICARGLAKWVHVQKNVHPNWTRDENTLWNDETMRQRAIFLDSYAMVQFYNLSRFCAHENIRVIDPENRIKLHKENGGLILTYHHHFFNHLGPVLGSLGLATSPITLSPESSPLLPLYDRDLRKPFETAEAMLHGGQWVFINPSAHSERVRKSVLTTIKNKENILMAVDFNNIFPWGKTISMPLYGRSLHVPTGLLNRMCDLDVDASIAYLYMTQKNSIELRLLSLPKAKNNPQTLLTIYFEHLSSLLISDPAFWEGWNDLTGD